MLLRFAAADKGSVFAIHFARDTLGPRLGDELYFADKIPAPGLIDARAELALHALKLFAPDFPVRGNFEIAAQGPNRPRMSDKSLSYDCGP